MTVEHLLGFFHICRNLRDIEVALICKLHAQQYTTNNVTLHNELS